MTIATSEFGSTGEHVTVLGFGAMELRGTPRGRDIPDEESGRLLNEVLDLGINYVDTSIDYGKSEDLIGRYISSRRSEYFLASKCGCLVALDPAAQPPYPHDYSRANVRAGVEQSLRRLRTDVLDLVQVHMSPSREEMEREGTIEELVALRDEGKIRFIGMSGTLPELPDQIAMGVFDAFQIPYSAVQREHEQLISAAAEQGAGTVIRGGIAKGAGADDASRASPEHHDRVVAAGLDDLLDGMSPSEFVLRFTLSHPGLHTTIVGTSNIDHLRSNVATAERGPLPADVYEEAKRRFARTA